MFLCVVKNAEHGVMYRWFDSGQDDGLIERELDVVHYVSSPPPPPQEPLEDKPGLFPLLIDVRCHT